MYGAAGALGSEIVKAAHAAGHLVLGFGRSSNASLVDDGGPWTAADAVINCAAVIRRKFDFDEPSRHVYTNAVLPWNLRQVWPKSHFVHISTDAVFDGQADDGWYTPRDQPTPMDLYERSKLAGEVSGPNTTTIRLSHVGWSHGLLAEASEKVKSGAIFPGYANDVFNGGHTRAVARKVLEIAVGAPRGLIHIGSPSKWSKYTLLSTAFDAIGYRNVIMHARGPYSGDRSLFPTAESDALPTYAEQMADFKAEYGELIVAGRA